GGITLRIAPKVPALNLLALIDYAETGVAWQDDLPGFAHAEDLVRLLGGLFVRRAGRVARRGWVRGYREEEAALPALRGRLVLAKEVARTPADRSRMACRYEEFTANVAPNRVLLAGLAAVWQSGLFDAEDAAVARKLATSFEGVVPAAECGEAEAILRRDRRYAGYAPALSLARLLLGRRGAVEAPGATPLASFVVDLSKPFEAAVTRALRRASERLGWMCRAQPTFFLDEGRRVEVRPDVVVERGPLRLVADAKYKDPDGGLPPARDFEQVLAYLARLETLRGAIFLPARAESSSEEEISLRAFGRRASITVLRVPLGGPARGVVHALESAAEAALARLDAPPAALRFGE
ncbi:MAG TPA: hypothetical protein VFS00_33170, partial [Polyangiaceae bacterium]|nr:hypothetical protein [Polyangiaceae bacterium]